MERYTIKQNELEQMERNTLQKQGRFNEGRHEFTEVIRIDVTKVEINEISAVDGIKEEQNDAIVGEYYDHRPVIRIDSRYVERIVQVNEVIQQSQEDEVMCGGIEMKKEYELDGGKHELSGTEEFDQDYGGSIQDCVKEEILDEVNSKDIFLTARGKHERSTSHDEYSDVNPDKEEKPKEENIPYVCHLCAEQFPCEKQIYKHMSSAHRVYIERCKKCGEELKSKKEKRDHMLTEHARKSFVCKKCNTVFKREKSFIRHKCYSCDQCGKIMSHKYAFQRHVQIHSETRIKKSKNVECYHCNQMFSDKYFVALHIQRQHADSKDNICPFCGKQFVVGSYSFAAHKLSHILPPEKLKRARTLSEYPLDCVICKKTFSSGSSTRKHLRNVHGILNRTKTFECKHCKISIEDADSLVEHVNSKTHCQLFNKQNMKQFQCNQCKKAFFNKWDLKNHISNHFHPIICLICSKRMEHKKSLTLHMKQIHPNL